MTMRLHTGEAAARRWAAASTAELLRLLDAAVWVQSDVIACGTPALAAPDGAALGEESVLVASRHVAKQGG
ncbi:hypothetical protein [Cellulomonas chengniuliangii]|uniref:hypothetical protein n=1 Tax=Cellulomonas chengniuliangii TaxID=2968084 RepID=UPI001D0E9C7E|nr:hypothetical protein [Cellulomonas chengniuliangii]MCC2317114.1 hypothetical protein [Cellulomonas chengniuliangii]